MDGRNEYVHALARLQSNSAGRFVDVAIYISSRPFPLYPGGSFKTPLYFCSAYSSMLLTVMDELQI